MPTEEVGDEEVPRVVPKQQSRKRVILFNGWERTHTYPFLWMRSLGEHLRLEHGTEVEVLGNAIPVQTARPQKYVDYLAALVQEPDEHTFFIGALFAIRGSVAMRMDSPKHHKYLSPSCVMGYGFFGHGGKAGKSTRDYAYSARSFP
jgi:hypothetical protein